MFQRILVPVDGSDTSNKALVTALELARESGGRVRILHAFDEMAHLSGFEHGVEVLAQAHLCAQKILDEALAIARASGVVADSRLVDFPGRRLGEVVADEARDHAADLVVVGTHGRRGVSRVLMGSDAEQVIRMAPVPVLVVRAAAHAPAP